MDSALPRSSAECDGSGARAGVARIGRGLGHRPDLAVYDHIVVNLSGGKDSQAALDVTVAAARVAGVVHRVTAVHADLGRLEWPGTAELAADFAAVESRIGHSFRVDLSMADVITDAARNPPSTRIDTWAA
ncbi:hypothetical protein GZH49_37670 [Nocardia terpenica]|uniref:hypothetical protein n=1 Tax=Nocardia terpenica TaxID=455432 RepID=UPI002FE2E29C